MKKNILYSFRVLARIPSPLLIFAPTSRRSSTYTRYATNVFALSRVRKLFQKDNNVYFFCEWITTFTLICRKVIHSHRNNYLLGEATLYPRQRKEKSLHMHKQHVRTHTNGKKTYQQKINFIYIYIYKEFNLIIIVEGRKLNTH